MKLHVYPPIQESSSERAMDEPIQPTRPPASASPDTEQRLWYLKNCNLIAQLPTDEITHLERVSRVRRFAKGEPVYLPSETADAVYLIARGLVKICHITPEGKTSTLALIGAGELFGELALFDAGQRGEYVEAIEPTTVVRIPSHVLSDLMHRHAALAIGISKLVGFRRQRIERRLGNLLFTPNRQRLAHLLLDLAEQFGV
ncbi:MAG: Crp/Fnr family transcriptional regulator, partial [Planctomycetota bacterium]